MWKFVANELVISKYIGSSVNGEAVLTRFGSWYRGEKHWQSAYENDD